jgi:aspartate racemase
VSQADPEVPLLGIVGGMGPLASSEFLRTIYRLHLAEPEQNSLRCLLLSDPSFPDRNAAIQEGRIPLLAERLTKSVDDLLGIGATRVVIPCITVHCALPLVPEPTRRRVISLLDLIVDELISLGPGPFLLLSTSGTRAARIFENHERWSLVSDRVTFLDEQDQERLHAWIYRLKAGEPGEACLEWVLTLPDRYGVKGLIFGCTELHLLQVGFGTDGSARVIDPLWIVARDLLSLLAAST